MIHSNYDNIINYIHDVLPTWVKASKEIYNMVLIVTYKE